MGGKSVISQDGGLAKFIHFMRMTKRELDATPLQKTSPVYKRLQTHAEEGFP